MATPATRMSQPDGPLLEQVDRWRLEASPRLDAATRSELGQFLTPSRVAVFMASLFERFGNDVHLLDAGAGVGTLATAAALEAISRETVPKNLKITAFEIDPLLGTYLRLSLAGVERRSREMGAAAKVTVVPRDFIQSAVEDLDDGLFRQADGQRFTHAILNPPYRKLSSSSTTRLLLRRVGIETSNLYAAFVALAIRLLEPGGELVAITPRSFCNGPYFRPFRSLLLQETALRRIHVFESRKSTFADDDVLQENVVFHVVKGRRQGAVRISSGDVGTDRRSFGRSVPFREIVRPEDPEMFIHLVPDRAGKAIATSVLNLPCRLADLGLTVSTGKVVDFRARKFLRHEPNGRTRPLIYPAHLAGMGVQWPKEGNKPNYLVDEEGTTELWMPAGHYVLVKRFSAKEERRRIVAAVFDPALVPRGKIGFENHLNVFHSGGSGVERATAIGLAAFLNSGTIDKYFRQFNGHTQVNATDLRSLRYPNTATLVSLSKAIAAASSPEQLDAIVENVIGCSAHDSTTETANKRSA